jgi:hypothetical protein
MTTGFVIARSGLCDEAIFKLITEDLVEDKWNHFGGRRLLRHSTPRNDKVRRMPRLYFARY